MKALRRKLWRDVRRQRAQFTAITVTVFLGIALFAASYDSFRNLEASYDRTTTEFRFANLFVQGGDVQAVAAAAMAEAEVEFVEVRVVEDLPLRLGDAKLLGRVVGLPAEDQPAVNRVKILHGTYLDPGDEDGVLVEEHLADHFDLGPGSSLEALGPDGWRAMRVVGVASSPEYIWPARDRQDLLTSPDDFGVIFAAGETATSLTESSPNSVVAYYSGGTEDADLTRRLTEAAWDAGAAEVYTRSQQPSNAALEEDLRGFEEMSLFFPILFLAAAAMAAYVMINRLVHSQRPHIGLLISEGYTRRQVLRHYLGYGMVPGILGAVPGAVVGVLLARLITGLYTELISVPVRVIELRASTLAAAVVFGIVVALVAAIAPARSAARMTPAEVMRGVGPPGRGRPSVAERAFPPLRRLPIRWRMALRGIERSPRRTVYTILGVVLSLVLVLVSWGMIDTMRFFFDRQFLEITREDARVFFAEPVTAEVVAGLEEIEEIAVAEPSLELAAALSANGQRYDSALVILEPDTRMHGFFATNGDEIALPDNGLLVGSFLGELLEVEEGEAITLSLPAVGVSVDAPIARFVDEPMGTVAYASRRAAATLAGGELPATSALVSYAAGVDRAEVRGNLTDLAMVAAVTDAKSLYEIVQRYMGLFYGFVGIMLAFGGAMAFALIFNSMSVNIAERTRETATLLAVGMKRRTIATLIGSENLVVAALGIPPGLVLGWWVSSLAMSSFNTDLFRFDLHMRAGTLVYSAAAMLVVALLSQWPGLRAIGRLDIPRIVKERST